VPIFHSPYTARLRRRVKRKPLGRLHQRLCFITTWCILEVDFEGLSHRECTPVDADLIAPCQQYLTHAWLDRVQHIERAVGPQVGFEVMQRETTTVLLAHQWPQNAANVPFHGVFNYRALPDSARDPLLDRLEDAHVDAMIEVLPGPHQAHTEHVLHCYAFQPVWSIPWLYIAVEQFVFTGPATATVAQFDPVQLDQLAALLIAGYGYTSPAAEAGRIFAQYGYAAPGFACFLAKHDEHPAAIGVLHLHHTSALVDGGATLPDYRGWGLQKVLLAARIRYAKEHGAQHAFSRTGSGSISQANMHKLGMRMLVQSTAWRRT
jgi:GNAT superfamily N-acetyltransferase